VSPVRYELGIYIPEDGILDSHLRVNIKSYTCIRHFTISLRGRVGRCVTCSGILAGRSPWPVSASLKRPSLLASASTFVCFVYIFTYIFDSIVPYPMGAGDYFPRVNAAGS
jgi:hypothetical protein